MPPRGAFSAKRKAFLESRQADFAAAVENNSTADGLAVIFRQYFKRFPVDLDDDVEPTDEALAAIDDNAADPDFEEPSDSLDPEEHAAALEALKSRQARIQAKRGQITRWFTYRYTKQNNIDPRSQDPKHPYNTLLLQLTGNLVGTKPRRKTPVNLWVRDGSSTHPIKLEVQRILNGRPGNPKKMVAIRSDAARIAFQKLSDLEQQKWKRAADEEYTQSVAEYENLCKGVVSTDPEDRQRAINGLVRFVQPILDRIALVTGFKVSLFAGGPEPARQGRLSLISMHSGTTGGDVPLNFGQAERVAYKNYIMPIWGRFMRACFTPEECRRRALPSSLSGDSLQSATQDQEGSSFHSFDIPESTSTAGPIPESKSSGDSIPKSPSVFAADAINPSVSRLSTSPRTPQSQLGITGISDAIRNLSRRIEESVARSIASSPTASLGPSPLPSAAPSPAGTTKRIRSSSGSVSAPKRSRGTDPSLLSCVAPPDAPVWVSSAIDMFASEPFDGKWQDLITAWLAYEARRDFEGKKLSPKGRPKVIADWIKWARKPTWRPSTFPKVADIDREHTAWWTSLQPAWRAVGDVLSSNGDEGGWSCLHVGGVNGLLSALASLFFWRLAIDHAKGSTDPWNAIVEDTLFVIKQLSTDLE